MRALMTTAAHAATKILKSIEPWYDWGTSTATRLDATERDYSDEAEGEVRFAELQWLGIHVGLHFGRTPPKACAATIALRKRLIDKRADAAEITTPFPSPVARHLQLVRSGNAQAVKA